MTREERLTDMIVYVKKRRKFHLKDIMEKYGVSNRTAKRDIHDLKKSGLNIHSFTGANGGCQVVDDKSMYIVFLKRKEIELIRSAFGLIDVKDLGVDSTEVGAFIDKFKKFL